VRPPGLGHAWVHIPDDRREAVIVVGFAKVRNAQRVRE
jgi:hypothetical protein